MTFEILINEHSSNRPGYEFLGHYEAGLPIYNLQIKVEVLRPVELSTVSQFVLRLINEGIQTESDIATMLGLDVEFVRYALIDLAKQRFVTTNYDASINSGPLFRIAQKGLTALGKALTASYVEHFYIGADGLTGELSLGSLQGLYNGAELKQQGMMLMHPVPRMKPTVTTLNTGLAQLASLYRKRAENGAVDDLVNIIDIDKTRILYKLVNVLVFAERASGRLDFNVFEGYEPATKYDEIFIRREREGRRVLPEAMLVSLAESGQSRIYESIRPTVEPMTVLVEKLEEIQLSQQELQSTINDTEQQPKPPLIITEKTRRIQELEDEKLRTQEELERLKAERGQSRLISNAEHRNVLLKALNDAQHRIIIVSPWIRRDSVDDDVLRLIEKRLQNGVQIIIGYGMPLKANETENNYIQVSVAKKFEQIKKRPYGKHFFIQYLGTHEKVLVCDQTFCVVTSFNWLSYRGNQQLRREKGVYSEDGNVITSVIDDVLLLFKDLPK